MDMPVALIRVVACGYIVVCVVFFAAMELAVECSTSYNREEDVLTVDCVTLVEGQTITGVLFEVNGGELLTGRKWSNPFSPLSLSLSLFSLSFTLSLSLIHSLTHSLTHTLAHISP